MTGSWSERTTSHTGTETRPRLLREAAVGNFPQWAKARRSDAAWGAKAFGSYTTVSGKDGCRRDNRRHLTVPAEEAPANSVPAAAVRQRGQALLGITGRKGRVGGMASRS